MTGYRLSDYLLRTVMAVKLAFLLILLLSTITQASAIATVSIGNLSSAYGETVTAPILISNVQNYGTGTISVTYDPSVVHVISVSSGPTSTVLAWKPDNTTGIVAISAWNTGGVSGDIIFANVTFHAVGSAGSSTPLNISVTTLKDISQQDITVIIKNGSFTIGAEQLLIPFLISGDVFYENGSECNNPHVNITNLNTGVAWQAETSPTSNYYQLVLRYDIDITAGEVLQFGVTSPYGCQLNITNYTITADDIANGGLFNFNISLESPVKPAPNITSSAPSSPVTDYSGATRTFNITIDQPVNVSWLINGTAVKDSEKGVTEASYANTSAVVGTWNVSAVVENANGTDMQTWIWNVMAPPVLVNEFVSNNATEWIELYNKKDYAISLTGWTIEDNTHSPQSLAGKTIPAGGYLVLIRETDFNFQLANTGDTIILKNGSLEVDKVAYGNYNDGNPGDNAPAPGAGKSAGRCPNGVDTNNDSADFRVFNVPTKGAPNTIYPKIIGFAPHTHVSDNEGATRTFNITVDQPVDVTWRINGTQVQTNASVPAYTSCSYTNTGAVAGYWEVTATASNENGSATQTWWWTVNDTTPPTVTDWAPTGTGVAITTSITATFSEPMNESTLNDETIIVENSTGSAIAGAVTYDSATRTVTFDPTANLEYNETYNVTITTGVADLAGNHLAAHKTWNFTTRSEVMEATISIGNASTNTGYTTVVPIRIDNATNLGSVDINLTYNSSVVIAVNVTGGDFDVTIPNLEHNVSGLVRIGAFQTENPGLNGGVNLTWVKLKAVGNTGENSPLNISVNTLRDATPQCNLIPYQVSNGTFTILLNGDVNGDGVVDIADAMYLAKHVLGITGFELIIEEAADVNGDDEIDLADAMYLAKYVLGIEGFEELK